MTASINVGSTSGGVAINPLGTYAYVANYGGTTVSVINTSTNTVSATIPVGSEPLGVALNPSGTYAYVANQGSSTVSVINLATNSVAATISVGTGPTSVAINPAGTYAYVTNFGGGTGNTVSIVNTATNSVTQTVTVGTGPVGMGNFVGMVGNNVMAYVSNYESASVSVIQLPTIFSPTISLTSTSGTISAVVAGATTSVSANTGGSGNAYLTGIGNVIFGASSVVRGHPASWNN